MIDYRSTYSDIIKNTTDAIKTAFPIEGRTNALVLDSVEAKPYEYDIDDEYNAKYQGKTLSTPVTGNMRVIDKASGNTISEKKIQLMKLPVYTRRGTFIVGGNEYNVDLQNRRLPGIYPIQRDTGEVEAEFNVGKGGGGRKMNMMMDAQSGKFKLQIGTGTSKAEKPLYPILAAMGVSDADIEKKWGASILDANRVTAKMMDKHILDSAFRITGEKYDNTIEASTALRERLGTMMMDVGVNAKTLGGEHGSITPDTMLRTSEKILNINKGLEPAADRNALHFKSIHGVEDFMVERINQHVRAIRKKLSAKVDRTPEVSKIISSNSFTGPIEQLFTKTSLAEIGSQYNPIDMLVSGAKITSLGEGGITKINTVRDEMRALHNTHAGFFDPIHTPESEKIGVTLHLANGVSKRGGKLYTQMFDPRTGQLVEVDHQSVASKTIALPGKSWDVKNNRFTGKTVRALRDQEMVDVPIEEVDYVVRNPQHLFGPATSLVPFLNSSSGGRIFMASKQIGQALNLKEREVPLVQSGKGKMSFEHFYGGVATGSVSPFDGIVKSIDSKYITLVSDDGKKTERIPVYKNFPLNSEHFLNTEKIHATPGQRVTTGQPLLDNNFTKDGVLALGSNLKVAYMPDGGYNFEDGITISEGASKKLTSMHLYPEQFRADDKTEINAKKFMFAFPNKVSADTLGKFEENGIIREGAIVNPGEPILMALRRADTDLANKTLATIGKKLKQPYRDASLYWEGKAPGVVDRVIKTEKGYKIYVKSEENVEIADKLAGRYGNKGVVTRILPDSEMPKDAKGNPFEILLNPLSVPSRINPSQMLETALGKVAKKAGKPIIIESFTGDNHQEKVQGLLRKHGFAPDGTEAVFDSEGKAIGNVLTGYQYTLKLSKQAKTGFSARGAGPGQAYDIDQAPAKGSGDGSKAMDLLSFYAMLSHGATANLREMATDKASNNPEFWRMVRNGVMLPAPKPTFAYEKFAAYLKGSGVNMERKGANLDTSPLTDADVEKLSNGEIRNPKFIQAKDLKPIRYGLMDSTITGGMGGNKWSHMNLAAPVINPLFKNGLQEILGMTEDEMMDSIKTSGTKGLQTLVSQVNLEELEKGINSELKLTKSAQKVNNLNKRLHYVRALKNFEEDPAKAYFLTKYPIIPPNMRPISQQDDGNQTVAQINLLYRDALLTNNSLKDMMNIPYLPESVKNNAQHSLQQAIEGIAGITDPLGRYPLERSPKGFVDQIKGEHAKEGYFQRKILRRTQDITGRGVITPDPKLPPDEIGLPEDMAWKIYDPFIERRLRGQGYDYEQIMDMRDKRTPEALSALKMEMASRPVMLNRPPSLHKFSFLAFKPSITNGQTIKIPPLVVKGFNADFDGDALMVHVPVRDEAVAEVRNKLMTTSNLFNPRDDSPIIVPQKEATVGLWKASRTTEGLNRIKALVPEEYRHLINPGFTGKDASLLLGRIGVESPETYAKIAQSLKDLGDDVAYRSGTTVNLNDLSVKDAALDKLRADVFADVSRFKGQPNMVNKILGEYDKKVQDIIKTHTENNFVQLSVSGGAGTMGQVKQMIGMPTQYTNEAKEAIPVAISSNFGQGMGINDYWTSLFSARRGMIERKMETADPGWFAKELLVNTTKTVANENATLDDDGEEFNINDQDAFNRYIAADVKDKKGNVLAKKGDVLTAKLSSRLQSGKVDKIRIHTVLSAKTDEGINPKSFGLFIEGRLPKSGDNLGAMAGQAIAEPLQQGAMKTFHTGGAVGTDTAGASVVKGYDVIKGLLELPENIKGSATLSTKTGTVENIEPNPSGGFNVTVGGAVHFIKPGIPVSVKKGEVLEAGTPLSSGIIHPKELLEVTNDMDKTRRYMVDALKDNYKATGTNVNRRILEVVVKSLTDTAKVDDPGDTDFIRGDVVSYDAILRHNNAPAETLLLTPDLIGKILTKPVNSYPAGTEITEDIMEELQTEKVTDVEVRNKPAKVTPLLIGVKTLPQKSGDLFSHMGYGYIERGLTEKLPAGASIPLHSTNPIPAYAYGAEFGKGTQPHTY